ncbi:hypothetical protein MBLNU457_5798t1 [Dothideomycetes sp. NU457]
MAPIQKVAVFGGTGNLGPSIVSSLAENGFEVTVLSRSSSTNSNLPSGVTIKGIDYSNQESIISALQGQQAVVSNVGWQIIAEQHKLIDAAIAAGVSLFLPSEFGADLTNAKAAALPVFAGKAATRRYIEAKAAEGKIDYTYIVPGNFLDWDVKIGFSVNASGVTTLLDGGNTPFAATNLSAVGRTVAAVLKDPAKAKNRAVFAASAHVTQNQLLKAIKKAKPGFEAKVEHVDSAELERKSYRALKEHDYMNAMIGFIRRANADLSFGLNHDGVDNELFGVKSLTEEEVDEVVASVVGA